MTAATELAQINYRLAAATPGPWFEFHENGTPGEYEAFHCPPATGAFLINYADHDQQNKDATLIANAPTDLARLTRAVEAVLEMADKWESEYGPGSRKEEVFGPQKVSIEFAVKSMRKAVENAMNP